MDIKPGDVVELKSGSLPLTVGEVQGDYAICYWFDRDELKQARIPMAALIKYEHKSRRRI